jgi:rRNA maturation protein Nop10
MRHLGFICLETNLPHIKQACKIEMIARSAKVLIRQACSRYVLRTKAQRDGSDVSLPFPIIYDKVKELIKEVFCFVRPEFGKVDIW